MAVRLNGTTQIVSLGLNVPLLNGDTGCTLMGWVRTRRTSGTDQRIISISIGPAGGVSNSTRMGIGLTSIEMFVIGRNLDANSPTTIIAGAALQPIAAGVWAHIACAYFCDTRWARLYINGILVGQGELTNAGVSATFSATNPKCARIGAGAQGIDSFFDGDLEDIRVYGRNLGDAEIATIHAVRGKDGLLANLQARWPLADGGEGIIVPFTADIGGRNIGGQPTASPVYSDGITGRRARRVL